MDKKVADQLAEITRKRTEYQESVKGAGKELVKELLSGFFERNSIATAIKWEQYTPHFNDGDPCVFNVHSPTIQVLGEIEGGDRDDGFRDSYDFEDGNMKQEIKDLEKQLDEFQDVLQQVFGDGVQITATRESIEVEEYNHD